MCVHASAWFVWNWWSLCWLSVFILSIASKMVRKMHFNDRHTYYIIAMVWMSKLTMRVNVCSFKHFSRCFCTISAVCMCVRKAFVLFSHKNYLPSIQLVLSTLLLLLIIVVVVAPMCIATTLTCKRIALSHSEKSKFYFCMFAHIQNNRKSKQKPWYQSAIAIAKWKFW